MSHPPPLATLDSDRIIECIYCRRQRWYPRVMEPLRGWQRAGNAWKCEVCIKLLERPTR